MSRPREALGPANDAGPRSASLGRLTSRDPRWPSALADLRQPPHGLYFRGDPSILGASPALAVAIVGTREASPYGLRVAGALAKAFAEAGAVVVSGLARGIDSAAHQGALAAGGKTVATLGTGPDVPYPVGNGRLLDEIARTGLVVSESPPGQAAIKGCFPRRNRIIAALTRATIVVEAGFKSGALNTATHALELGRVVAAVPGLIDAERAQGSNQLLRDGAQVITSVADALGLLSLSPKRGAERAGADPLDAEIWDQLGAGGAPPDDLAARAGVSVNAVLGSLARLELAGLVAIGPTGVAARKELPEASPPADRPMPNRVRETKKRSSRIGGDRRRSGAKVVSGQDA